MQALIDCAIAAEPGLMIEGGFDRSPRQIQTNRLWRKQVLQSVIAKRLFGAEPIRVHGMDLRIASRREKRRSQ